MSNQKTDATGQVVRPVMLTHVGDGATPLTNRDIAADLANLDIAMSALRDAITKTGGTAKSLKDVVDAIVNLGLPGLGGTFVGVISFSNVAAGATVTVDYVPTADKIALLTWAAARMDTDSASSSVSILIAVGGNADFWNDLYLAKTSGTSIALRLPVAGGQYLNSASYLRFRFYNAGSALATNQCAQYVAVER